MAIFMHNVGKSEHSVKLTLHRNNTSKDFKIQQFTTTLYIYSKRTVVIHNRPVANMLIVQ